MSGKTLLKGTIILAGAAFIARFLGVIQRIPLQRLLGDGGLATYVTSYNVYSVLLTLATAGFPSAIAKLVSENYALGRVKEAEAIRRTAVQYSLIAGVAAAVLVFVLAPVLSHINGDPDAMLAIRALSPALLLFPWIAVERGYFHGRQRMEANGLSQIWEQILRVITSIALAYLLLKAGFGVNWAAAGASFGGVLGAVAAAAVMLYYSVKLRRAERSGAKVRAAAGGGAGSVAAEGVVTGAGIPSSEAGSIDVSSKRSIFRAILKLSIPVSITALAVPVVYLIDSMVTIPLLRGDIGQEMALEALGWLTGRAQSIAGIPVIFAIALSQSILPIISSAYARNDHAEVAEQTSLALRVSMLSGIPVIVVLATSAFSLNTFIYTDTEGTWIIIALVCSVAFQIIMMTSNSILLGLGRADLPMKHIAAGVLSKLVLSFALAPFFGIYGIVAATASCFIVTMSLNLRSLRLMVDYTIMGDRAVPFLITVLAQGAVGTVLGWLVYHYVHPFGVTFWDAFLQTAVVASATASVYPVFLLRTRALTPEDIAELPPKLRGLWDKAEPLLRKLRII